MEIRRIPSDFPTDDFEKLGGGLRSFRFEQEDNIGVSYDPRISAFGLCFELIIGLALRLRRRLGLGVD